MLWKSLLVMVSIATPAVAQEITFSGQVRPRFEYRRSVGNGRDAFTSMRVRGQLAARLERNVRVLIQVQDVRLWGEETNTLGDFRADNFDLHQGYVEIASPGSPPPLSQPASAGRRSPSAASDSWARSTGPSKAERSTRFG